MFARRNDPAYWSGWISGDGPDRKVKVTQAHFEENGLELTREDNDTTYILKAVPGDAAHTRAYLDDNPLANAALVFQPKPSSATWPP